MGESVPKILKDQPRMFGVVRRPDSVVQMNFNFSPTGMAVLCEPLDKIWIVLFCGPEISMAKGKTVAVEKTV